MKPGFSSSISHDVDKLFALILKHYKLIAVMMLCGQAVALAATLVMPKQYKARMVLTVYARYFQNPLIRDFVPEVFDSSELRAQRESLLRLAVDQRFLDHVGGKYRIYKTSEVDAQRTIERQELAKRFEMISLNQNTFQISFSANSPLVAYQVTEDLLARINSLFAEERQKVMITLRSSIQKQLRVLGLSLQKDSDPLVSLSSEALVQESRRLKLRMDSLKTQYTDRHPAVANLKQRASLIEQWIFKLRGADGTERKNASETGSAEISNSQSQESLPDPQAEFSLSGDEPSDARLEVYRDLFRKYVYLSISLNLEDAEHPSYFGILENPSIPGAPFSPNRSYFVIVGLMLGLIAAAIALLFIENRAPVLAKAAAGGRFVLDVEQEPHVRN